VRGIPSPARTAQATPRTAGSRVRGDTQDGVKSARISATACTGMYCAGATSPMTSNIKTRTIVEPQLRRVAPRCATGHPSPSCTVALATSHSIPAIRPASARWATKEHGNAARHAPAMTLGRLPGLAAGTIFAGNVTNSSVKGKPTER
jgi:hypothetical protein